MSRLVAVILAAGKGKRMKSDLPKVLHKINDRPMVHYVIDLAKKVGSEKTILIIGHGKELVMDQCKNMDVQFAVQQEQLGTGHAVLMSADELNGYDGDVLVLSGDVPLLTAETIRELINTQQESGAAATILTSELDDPTGYGRIIRDKNNFVSNIVEHKDANPEELKIREINVGIYIFKAVDLFRALKLVRNDNNQGEYYLPDVVPIFLSDGKMVNAVKTKNFNETRGINDVDQLKEAETILNSER
ncbi:MAG: sugar phosphate nucleotidyltransferase [Calditrichaceae bacterium]